MARRGLSVFACDASTSMVAATRRRCTGLAVHVEQQDANMLRLPASGFTIVHSSWVLHWVVHAADAVRSMVRAVRPGGALVLQWSHSQPLAEGPGMVGIIREVAARPQWRDRLAAAPFTNQQHPVTDVAAVVASEGMEIVEQDTNLRISVSRPTGSVNLAAVRRNLRLTGFAQQAAALGGDVDRFIEECVAAVAATGEIDPRDARLIARRPT
jgi:SAM-dependent methyltransferase